MGKVILAMERGRDADFVVWDSTDMTIETPLSIAGMAFRQNVPAGDGEGPGVRIE
jgi:hypothetical protein